MSENITLRLLVTCEAANQSSTEELQYLISGLMLEILRYSMRFGDNQHSIRDSIESVTITENNEFYLTYSQIRSTKP
jgi:hypothetical protein